MSWINKSAGGFISLAVLALAFSLFLGTSRVQAQSGSPPPTYDYDAGTPGTQPPTSPLIAGHETRSLRTHQLTISVFVPLSELQAILPSGFMALANPAASNTALVTLSFVYQVRLELTAGGTFGPASLFSAASIVSNTDLGRQESLLLGFWANEPTFVDAINAHFGSGSSRLAETEVEIQERAEALRLIFDVEDKALGLHVKAGAEDPAAIANRVKIDPDPRPRRFLNNGVSPNPAFRIAVQDDRNTVPTASANVKIRTRMGKLQLPGGDLTIMGISGSVVFHRWLEIFTKLEE